MRRGSILPDDRAIDELNFADAAAIWLAVLAGGLVETKKKKGSSPYASWTKAEIIVAAIVSFDQAAWSCLR